MRRPPLSQSAVGVLVLALLLVTLLAVSGLAAFTVITTNQENTPIHTASLIVVPMADIEQLVKMKNGSSITKFAPPEGWIGY
jgi:hypothetical protein